MAIVHSEFYQGQPDRGVIYWPQNSEETWLHQLKEEKDLLQYRQNCQSTHFENKDWASNSKKSTIL
jgi:hypothetical protein